MLIKALYDIVNQHETVPLHWVTIEMFFCEAGQERQEKVIGVSTRHYPYRNSNNATSLRIGITL
jgi:hypothetical protein